CEPDTADLRQHVERLSRAADLPAQPRPVDDPARAEELRLEPVRHELRSAVRRAVHLGRADRDHLHARPEVLRRGNRNQRDEGMRRVAHDTWASIVGVLYLGLMVNLLVLVTASPLVVLLITTDPMRSWPLLAVTAPLATPALTAAFGTFRAHGEGETEVVRTFLRVWRRTLRG